MVAGARESEQRELRTHVEANLDEKAEPAVDVHRASGSDVERARRVPLVADGEDGWRKEGRLHLTAVRVAGQHPAAHAVPER